MGKQVSALLFVLLVAGAGCDREKKGEPEGSATPTGPTSPAPSGGTRLTVSPSHLSFSVGQKGCYTASGGDGRYRWVLDTGYGAPVSAGTNARACYVSSFPVKFKMTVYSANQEATALGEVR